MLYLAMTAGEMERCQTLPPQVAFMACHFSPCGPGLSNCPKKLPKGSVITVNDRSPISGHDPKAVERQLREMIEEFQPSGVLLDFQRPGGADMAKRLVEALPCPTGVSEDYAEELDCPVFLSPAPLCRPLTDRWPGREKWLDTPIGSQTVTVTGAGAEVSQWLPLEAIEEGFYHERLAVRYRLRCQNGRAVFTLSRGPDELKAFMSIGKNMGITRFFCLYQELPENNT